MRFNYLVESFALLDHSELTARPLFNGRKPLFGVLGPLMINLTLQLPKRQQATTAEPQRVLQEQQYSPKPKDQKFPAAHAQQLRTLLDFMAASYRY